MRRRAAALCAGLALLAGCATAPGERPGGADGRPPGAAPAPAGAAPGEASAPADGGAPGAASAPVDGRASGAVSAPADGGAPGAASAPVDGRRATGLPPVVDRVATRDPVVFLTYDDGAERDPRFVDLVRERRLPVSLFLTDSVVGPGYAHFARLRGVGASLQNHTLDHPALRGLPYAGQRAEICGQQHKLRARFGVRPRLFRPPYGTYDTTTLRAAADCGIRAVVLWRVSLDGDGELDYRRGARRLRPGDIVSVPSGDTDSLTLAERTRSLLREIDRRGLRVGRLEDHLEKGLPDHQKDHPEDHGGGAPERPADRRAAGN
ncbi:polysaccharide deacetylase family protein [Streptomyces sp. NPDC017943]|uniref:polysaccharide deacetylase family protein n=1 Tax=Streptomyces sp. NPDC017943 TaxID=3365019 RepID=UPI00379440A9